MTDIYLYPMISGGIDSFAALCIAIKNCSNIKAIRPIFFNRSYSSEGHSALIKERDSNNNILSYLKKKYSTIKFEKMIEINIPFKWYVIPKINGYSVFPWARNFVFISVLSSKIAIDFQMIKKLHIDEGIIIVGFHKNDVRDANKYFLDSCNKTLVSALEQYQHLKNDGSPHIRVEAPLIDKDFSKTDTIKWLNKNKLNYIILNSWSCYKGESKPCGECTGCKERNHALENAKL